MDLSSQFSSVPLYYMPWIAFVAGLGGSLHCIGMCGGLVVSCAPTKKSIITYQFGRLLGYSTLGLLAGLFGQIFTLQKENRILTLLPSLLIGGLLISWGIQSFRGKTVEIKLPKFLNLIISKLWKKALTSKDGSRGRSFLVGGLSIFLPCGLLYGIVLTLASFQNPLVGLLCMAAFWLGTVPAMGLAPELVRRVFKPLFKFAPRFSSVVLFTIGLSIIIFRVLVFCH